MRITSKGQVTIPLAVRERLGLLPHTDVHIEVAGDHARISKVRRSAGTGARSRKAVSALWGAADARMSTDEIMALTRDESSPARRQK